MIPSVPDRWHYPRKTIAQKILDGFQSDIVSLFSIYAPRRSGKTHLLWYDIAPAAEKAGYWVVYADLWTERDRPDLALLAALSARLAVAKGRSVPVLSIFTADVKKLGLKGALAGIGEIGVDLDFTKEASKPQEGSTSLMVGAVLDALLKAAKKHHILLLVDEVQTLADPKWVSFVSALRGLLSARQDKVKTVFTGSSVEGLQRMFNNAKAAFFNSGMRLNLPPLGRPFVDHLCRVFTELSGREISADEAEQYAKRLHYSPFYFRRLVARCLLQKEPIKLAYQRLWDEIAAENEFAQRWAGLSELDRQILLHMRIGSSLYAQDTLSAISSHVGTAVTASVLQGALRRLVRQRMLSLVDRGQYIVQDEVFLEWAFKAIAADMQKF